MRDYRERLGAPASWWLVITACAALLGTTLWAGLSLTVAAVIYAALESACALVLLRWGATTIEVAAGELRAGSQRLPLGMVAEVTGLTRAQTAALRGPRADPAAYLLVRPYLPRAVYVGIAGRPAGRPYWLIGTRHPDELAAAIERAAAAAGRNTAVASGHAEEDGAGRAAPGAVG
jgi:hypothetical protein